jgi:hypothetical protein
MRIPRIPKLKLTGAKKKRERVLLVFHSMFVDFGVVAFDDWDDFVAHLRRWSPEQANWSRQDWLMQGAVLLEVNRDAEGAVFSVDEPGFTARQFNLFINPTSYPDPFADMYWFQSEHGQPEVLKFCELVPIKVWPFADQMRVKAYLRGVAKKEAQEQADWDRLEQKRREEEELRKAGFPPHLGYLPRPPEE